MTPSTLPFLAAGFFDSGALKLLLEGGVFMWPILILLILAIAVIIERYRSLKLLETDASALREEVIALLSEDKVEESLELCDSARGPARQSFRTGCGNTSSFAGSTTIPRSLNSK